MHTVSSKLLPDGWLALHRSPLAPEARAKILLDWPAALLDRLRRSAPVPHDFDQLITMLTSRMAELARLDQVLAGIPAKRSALVDAGDDKGLGALARQRSDAESSRQNTVDIIATLRSKLTSIQTTAAQQIRTLANELIAAAKLQDAADIDALTVAFFKGDPAAVGKLHELHVRQSVYHPLLSESMAEQIIREKLTIPPTAQPPAREIPVRQFVDATGARCTDLYPRTAGQITHEEQVRQLEAAQMRAQVSGS